MLLGLSVLAFLNFDALHEMVEVQWRSARRALYSELGRPRVALGFRKVKSGADRAGLNSAVFRIVFISEVIL